MWMQFAKYCPLNSLRVSGVDSESSDVIISKESCDMVLYKCAVFTLHRFITLIFCFLCKLLSCRISFFIFRGMMYMIIFTIRDTWQAKISHCILAFSFDNFVF